MSFYKKVHWITMSIGLGDIGYVSVFLTLRFGSLDKIKTVNQTKPCDWVKKWFEYNQTKCGFLQFWFRLVQCAVFLICLVLNTMFQNCNWNSECLRIGIGIAIEFQDCFFTMTIIYQTFLSKIISVGLDSNVI